MSDENILIDAQLLQRLRAFLTERGSTRDMGDVIGDAIEYWMENATVKPGVLMPEIFLHPKQEGYFWKMLFLPSGSLVRVAVGRKFYFAKVEGTFLLYQGSRIRHAEFLRMVTGRAKTEWKSLWIKRPWDSEFVPATEIRSTSR